MRTKSHEIIRSTKLQSRKVKLRSSHGDLLTDSNSDDVTTALVTSPTLMLVRTGAPNPIEESCRLGIKE